MAATFINELQTLTSATPPGTLPNLETVRHDVDGLIELSASGCWTSVLALSEFLLDESRETVPPHKVLGVHSARVEALYHMKFFQQASEEIKALGSLDQKKYTFAGSHHYPDPETYTRAFHSNSFIPFTLRLLAALLPAKRGQSTASLVLLIALKRMCDKNEEDGKNAGNEVAEDLWGGRALRVRVWIMSHHALSRDTTALLRCMRAELKKFPGDPDLLGAAGRAYLQLGAVERARVLLARAASAASVQNSPMATLHRGFLALAQNQLESSQEYFVMALAALGSADYGVASGNAAAILLLQGDVTRALEQVQGSILSSPDNLSASSIRTLGYIHQVGNGPITMSKVLKALHGFCSRRLSEELCVNLTTKAQR